MVLVDDRHRAGNVYVNLFTTMSKWDASLHQEFGTMYSTNSGLVWVGHEEMARGIGKVVSLPEDLGIHVPVWAVNLYQER